MAITEGVKAVVIDKYLDKDSRQNKQVYSV